MVESSIDPVRGAKRRLGRDQDEASTDQAPKRQRWNGQVDLIPTGGIPTARQVKKKSKRGCLKDADDDKPLPRWSRFDKQGSSPQHGRDGGADEPLISTRTGIPQPSVYPPALGDLPTPSAQRPN